MIIDIILFLAFIATIVSVMALLIAILQGGFDKNNSKPVISPTHLPLSRISPSLLEVKEKMLLSEANGDEAFVSRLFIRDLIWFTFIATDEI